jgi:hypothetical protein
MYLKGYANGEEVGGIGAGRVIHRSILEDDPCIFRPKANCGQDGFSAFFLYRKGYVQKIVETNELPVMLDIKTNTNINPPIDIWPMRDQDVPVQWVREVFGLVDGEILDGGAFDLLSFDGFHDQVIRLSKEIRKDNAFNSVNIKYEMAFGERRYKDYDSYRVQVSKRNKR